MVDTVEQEQQALNEAVDSLMTSLAAKVASEEATDTDKAKLESARAHLMVFKESQNIEDIESALHSLIQGTKWQSLFSSTLAFAAGLLAFSANNLAIPGMNLSESQKNILLSLPPITATYSRLSLGIDVSRTGGCPQAVRFIQLSAIGLMLTAVASILTTSEWSDNITINSNAVFSVEMVAALLAGFGFASVSNVPNSIGWFSKTEVGMVSAFIPGIGGSIPGLSDLLSSFLVGPRAQNAFLIALNVLMVFSIAALRSDSFGFVPTPYQQLVNSYGLESQQARRLAEAFGQHFFPGRNIGWGNYLELIKSPSSWLYNSNYLLFFGAFIGLTAALRLPLVTWGYSESEARLYSAVFSISSSIARTMVGVPLQYLLFWAVSLMSANTDFLKRSTLDNDSTHGAVVNMAGALLMSVGCCSLASVPLESLSNLQTFLPILLIIATGIGFCTASTLKRIAADKSLELSVAVSLATSIGPMGSFIFAINSSLFVAEGSRSPAEEYQTSFYVYIALALVMGAIFLLYGPHDRKDNPNKTYDEIDRGQDPRDPEETGESDKTGARSRHAFQFAGEVELELTMPTSPSLILGSSGEE